jgi:hypothetical protein
MFLLNLVAVLSGTPLRLSETAHDLERAVGQLVGEDALNVPDGRVGDDSDTTIIAKGTTVTHLVVPVGTAFKTSIIDTTKSFRDRAWSSDLPFDGSFRRESPPPIRC